ncbi:uncharacterized protein PV07_04996 [Cladophialophora immunda]|uniref:Uncharacterized protein n=1 Tax=Cladophialophora immunda TaxID=569365 RepID=A0A0D2CFZ8_9EURO|nr:uncharacterized protein PV07_04996 [Cladophialophora immunda]KIW29160.1 hypothetical protein PV07_04996 [Cladophialophora immunda]
MAEVLGVVAGGAGLASLALQLFEVSQKLHELRANIRDAPADVREILDEVDLLRTVLSQYLNVSGVADTHRLPPTLVQKQALDHCFRVLSVLHNIAQELETTMRNSSSKRLINWAKVEAVFNRKRFVKLQTALERAKSTLVLAILTNPSSKPRIPENGIVINEPSRKESTEVAAFSAKSTSLKAPATSTRTTSTGSWIAKYNIGIANVYVRSNHSPQRAEAENGAPQNRLRMSVSFASWIFSTALSFMFDRRPQGIRVALQINRLVRPDAEIFHLCAAGDAMGVRRSIADGKASGCDVTYEGVTPLMVASQYGHAEVCRVLLDAGADVTASFLEISGDITLQVTALTLALNGTYLPPSSATALSRHVDPWFDYWLGVNKSKVGGGRPYARVNTDTVRVLVEQGGSCIDFGWSPPSCNPDHVKYSNNWTPVHLSRCTPEDFLWLMAPERINFVGKELDMFYMSVAFIQCYVLNSDPRRIFTAFSKVTDLSRLAKFHEDSGATILDYLVSILPFVKGESLRCLILMLDQLVQAGAIETAESLRRWALLVWTTAMSLHRYMSKHRAWQPELASRILTSGLNLWLQVLGRAKVDILRYLVTQCERGAADAIECYVSSTSTEKFPEHFLDQKWYVQLSFRDNAEANETHNHLRFWIEAKYFSVRRTYPAPGGWLSDEAEGSQQGADDMDQLHIDGLHLGNSDDELKLEGSDEDEDETSDEDATDEIYEVEQQIQRAVP